MTPMRVWYNFQRTRLGTLYFLLKRTSLVSREFDMCCNIDIDGLGNFLPKQKQKEIISLISARVDQT